LKRCFKKKKKIIDCDWEYLSTLRTVKLPHEPMPQLRELLEYVAQPDLQYLWILLDIKHDNDAENVMRLIAQTIESVKPGARPWNDRIVLGIWAAKFLPLCMHHLPGFPISHIGLSTCYARQFLKVPNVSFNMLQKVLFGPIGANFIKDVKDAGRQIFIWTVNSDNMMRWGIQKEVDGVITDDPKRFKEICDNWTDNEPIVRPSVAQWLYTFWLYMLIGAFFPGFKWQFPETVDQIIGRKAVRAKYRARLTEG
jgi:glycerophosphoryl diester phosphodiesterase